MDGKEVNEYVEKLRKLSEYCEFGDDLMTTFATKVCGLNNEQIQRQLLSKTTLAMQKAIDKAVAMGIVSKDARELRGKRVSTN